jgi:hypothetical protein
MAGLANSEKDHCSEDAVLALNGPGSPSQGYIPADCWPMARKVWVTFIIWYVQFCSRLGIRARLLMTVVSTRLSCTVDPLLLYHHMDI